MLERAALDGAAAWAGQQIEAVRAEGRAVAGGWPGTMSEARGCARAQLALKGARHTHDELEWLAHATYARARDAWLAHARNDDDDEWGDLEATG